MAKTAGDIRASKWEGDIYHENGVRKEYYELSNGRKKAIRVLYKQIAKQMFSKFKNTSVALDTDEGKIDVQFNITGLEHFARDAMLILSGKYMSRQSMLHIDKILAESVYVPTNHELNKQRQDGIEKVFKYKDKETGGRGIFFKVVYKPKAGDKKFYSLYSVSDGVFNK